MSRPIKLNKEIIAEMAKYVSEGSSYRDAATLCGVVPNTFLDWRKRGEEDMNNGKDSLFSEFLRTLKESEAKAKAEAIRYIQRSDDWKARAWYLERKYNDEFGNKQKIEHSGDDEKPVVVKLKWD